MRMMWENGNLEWWMVGGVVECGNGFVGFDLQEGVKEGEEGVEDVVEDGV